MRKFKDMATIVALGCLFAAVMFTCWQCGTHWQAQRIQQDHTRPVGCYREKSATIEGYEIIYYPDRRHHTIAGVKVSCPTPTTTTVNVPVSLLPPMLCQKDSNGDVWCNQPGDTESKVQTHN